MAARESRPVATRAAQNLDSREIPPIVPSARTLRRVSARPVATARVDRLESPHDIAFRLWDRTATLLPGSTVRIVVGAVWPPVYLPDVRTDLAYAIDTWRGDIADAWMDALNRVGVEAGLA